MENLVLVTKQELSSNFKEIINKCAAISENEKREVAIVIACVNIETKRAEYVEVARVLSDEDGVCYKFDTEMCENFGIYVDEDYLNLTSIIEDALKASKYVEYDNSQKSLHHIHELANDIAIAITKKLEI